MEANELMIGDWVQNSNHDVVGKVILINTQPDLVHYQNKSATIQAVYPTGNILYNCKVSLLEPVPLTQEILEKNGWKCAKGGTMMGVMNIADRYDFTIKNENNGTKWWIYVEDDGETEPRRWTIQVQGSFNILGSIGYVHELQHALRLAGIKKEIVL